MKYKGIIFDLDGVICSTDEFHYQAWKWLAGEIGAADFGRADNDLQRGVSRMESLEVVLKRCPKHFSSEEKLYLAEKKNEIYIHMLEAMTSEDLSDEVLSTLEILKAKGYLLAIGSSSKNARLILNKIGLGDFFHKISDGNKIQFSKPNPEVFLLAAGYLKLRPEECLVVEDARAGIDAGAAGGFDTAAIGDAVDYEKAVYRLERFSDILQIL